MTNIITGMHCNIPAPTKYFTLNSFKFLSELTIVRLYLAHILLGLYLNLLVLLDVVADRLVVAEVHLAGFVDVERLTGDVDQTRVQTEEEENGLQ